jgi:hypothetical protein
MLSMLARRHAKWMSIPSFFLGKKSTKLFVREKTTRQNSSNYSIFFDSYLLLFYLQRTNKLAKRTYSDQDCKFFNLLDKLPRCPFEACQPSKDLMYNEHCL